MYSYFAVKYNNVKWVHYSVIKRYIASVLFLSLSFNCGDSDILTR
jgi:hypothetical protein